MDPNRADETAPGDGGGEASARRAPATMRDAPALVDRIPVAVFVRRVALHGHPWLAERREVVAVLPADASGGAASPATVHAQGDEQLLRYDGLVLELHPDEAESYYFNLVAPEPQCYVVLREDEAGVRVPFIVTPSFDLANAYTEGDDLVENVPLDTSLHAPLEAFTLTWYVPEKTAKRRRADWKGGDA